MDNPYKCYSLRIEGASSSSIMRHLEPADPWAVSGLGR